MNFNQNIITKHWIEFYNNKIYKKLKINTNTL